MTNAPTTRETADHAELTRLAEAATPGPWAYRDMTPNTYGPAFVDADDVRNLAICGEAVGRSETHGFCLQVDSEVRMANAAFIAAANPATVLSLLSEIAALREEVDEQEATKLAAYDRLSVEILDRDKAERQRDELRKAGEAFLAEHDKANCGLIAQGMPKACAADSPAMASLRQALANQGADQ